MLLLGMTALSRATIAVGHYYTNDDDVTVIKMMRVKVLKLLTAVIKSGGCGHRGDGPYYVHNYGRNRYI